MIDPIKNKRQRILFFDIIRILAVVLLLLHHTPQISAGVISPFSKNDFLFRFIYDNGKFLTYYITSGPIGVYLLVFISGAVLYQSNKARTLQYGSFIWGRFRRLYPAYWVALALCLLVSPAFILPDNYFIAQISGFLPGASYFQWWIGLFMSLYLVFPLLAKLVKRYPIPTLVVSFVITIICRLIIPSGAISFLGFPLGAVVLDRIVFPCFLFEFTLGIFIAQKKLYPKKLYSNSILFFIADVSYFVFLTHQFIRFYLSEHNQVTFWSSYSIITYISTVIVVSTVLMFLDGLMQTNIKKIENVVKNHSHTWRSKKSKNKIAMKL